MIVTTVEGIAHQSTKQSFLRRIAARLSAKWQKPLSTVSNWVRVRVQFALIKAVVLRTRGFRKKWRSSGLEDGEGISILFQREWSVVYFCLNSIMFCIDSGFGISCLGFNTLPQGQLHRFKA